MIAAIMVRIWLWAAVFVFGWFVVALVAFEIREWLHDLGARWL